MSTHRSSPTSTSGRRPERGARGAPRGRGRRRDAGRRRRPEGRGGGQRLAVEPLEGDPSLDYAAHVFARQQEFVLKARATSPHPLQKKNPQTDVDYDELFHELVKVDGELRRHPRRVART